jgi:hypothetical protein
MRRQNGFGAIQAILIIVIVGIVGFTGWFVWQSQKQTKTTYDETATVGSVPANAKNYLGADCTLDTDKRGKTYTSEYGYSLCIPNGWTVFISQSSDMKTESIIGENLTYEAAKSPLIKETDGKDGPFDFSVGYNGTESRASWIPTNAVNKGVLQAVNVQAIIYEYTTTDDTGETQAAVKDYVFTHENAVLDVSSANISGRGNKNIDLIEAVAKTVNWK